jgi:hypothetical protein
MPCRCERLRGRRDRDDGEGRRRLLSTPRLVERDEQALESNVMPTLAIRGLRFCASVSKVGEATLSLRTNDVFALEYIEDVEIIRRLIELTFSSWLVAVRSLARWRRQRRSVLVDAADHDGMDCAVVLTACSSNRHRLTRGAWREVPSIH